MTIDHIGYAVKRIEKAIEAFQKLGFIFEPTIEDTDRNVRIAFGDKDGYRIELVAPLDKDKASPVNQYIQNTVGIPYHICYKSDDFDKMVNTLKNDGYKVVIEPTSAVAFDKRRVVFMYNIGFGLVEIVEM